MIIGYLRVSTGKQNPANQQDEIRRFADSRNLSVSQWVTEVASGKKKECDRKLGGLIRRMKHGDTLIVTEISRLSRTLTDLMAIMGKCLEKGINLYTTKEGYSFDNSINSKVLCFAFGLVAEIERNLISMRTKEALADPARQEQIRAEVSALSAQIKALRREVKLCEDIAARSLSLKEKIRAAREEQQAGKTEKTREEQGRRKRLERR